jgi:uncharacterized protein YkwD
MTLTKIKPKRPTVEHRKRAGQHHHHGHHYIKTYWPYLPMIAVLAMGLVANSWLGQLHRGVLGYATDISIQSLLNGTNDQRSSNGEGGLNVSTALNQAAQAKANDMATRDYWSHNTPDGQTPWSFISAAGYTYQTAGENLAYGFNTADDTITGWMNSPEHRANVLSASYRDVGFGIVNVPSYQGNGPETLVVALYGSMAGEAVAAATPHAAPTNIPSAANHSAPAPAATSRVSSPAPVVTPANTTLATAKPADTTQTKTTSQVVVEPKQHRVSRIRLVATGSSSWGTLLVSLLAVGGFALLFLRHSFAWHKTLVRGERFVLHHPALDILAVTLVTVGFILSRTAGIIR